MDVLETIDWAVNTIREKVTFGFDENEAAKRREIRAKGALISAREEIVRLREENEKLKYKLQAIENILEIKTSEMAIVKK